MSKKDVELVRVTLRLRNRPNSPLLINPATQEMLDELFKSKSARKEKNMDLSMQEVASNRLYTDSDGNLGFPVRNLLANLVGAGRFVKYEGKSNLSTRTDSLLPGFINIEGIFIRFNKERTSPWKVSKMRGVIPSNGIACCIVRPEFENWVTEDIHFTFSPAELAVDKVQELFYKAGKMIGIGDFRPACKGPFGKYYVCYWKTEELDREPLEMDKE